MRKNHFPLFPVFTAICLFLLFTSHSARSEEKTPLCALDINPALSDYQAETQIRSRISLRTGDEFSLGLIVFRISGLDTFQADIRFDPACLAYAGTGTDRNISDFLTGNQGNVIQMPVLEKTPGMVTIAGAIIGSNPAESVSGNGPLGVLRFRVLKAERDIPLTIENVIFLNSHSEIMENPRIQNAVIQPRDISPPTVEIISGFYEISSPVPITILFSESVSGFDSSDIRLSNAGISDFSGSKERYTFQLLPKEKGEITIRIPVNTATDAAGNGNLPSEEGKLMNILNHPPVLSGEPEETINIGETYRFIPAVSDADKTDELSFSIENAPEWADFNTATGEFGGIPAAEDKGLTEGIIIRVTDSDGAGDTIVFDLRVREAETDMKIMSDTDGEEGSTEGPAPDTPSDTADINVSENKETGMVPESGSSTETKKPEEIPESGSSTDAETGEHQAPLQNPDAEAEKEPESAAVSGNSDNHEDEKTSETDADISPEDKENEHPESGGGGGCFIRDLFFPILSEGPP